MRQYRKLAAAAALLLTAGCASFVDQRGNLPEPDKLALIRPGLTTKEEVQQLLGTPSSTGTFDDSTWYYISKRTEQTAFFAPNTVDQKVVTVEFDPNGRVREVRHHGLEDAKSVAMVDRATPTPGKTLGFLEQLFGNLGRFNTPDSRPSRGQI